LTSLSRSESVLKLGEWLTSSNQGQSLWSSIISKPSISKQELFSKSWGQHDIY